MKKIAILCVSLALGANPTTLLDEESGFYKNASKEMIALYGTQECALQEIINYIPLNAICIISLERHKNGKARIEYMGQKGWVDVSKNPDDIILMSYEETQVPTISLCTQVGSYLFEVKSIQEGKAVKVYEEASTKSKLKTTLPDHESCLINLGCEWPWCRVDYGDGEGWILSVNLTDEIQNVDGYCYPRERNFLINEAIYPPTLRATYTTLT